MPGVRRESVADSNAPRRVAIRADIKRRIAAGQSDGEIRAAYVDDLRRVRPALARRATASASSCGALPVAALMLGGGGHLALALRRWSRQPRLAATAADEDAGRDARARRAMNGPTTATSSRRSATSCCGRSTTSRPSATAGNIDDETYARLHDDYTARAAAVLRALDGEPVELRRARRR